ncbi:hypothetical protein NKZ05_04315 [Stutzerimonas stutzeri]|uniref:hypothetical protein n=1 Tax=Stutzerimonas stutzeri TaxID=316 RepID=UPI00387DC830
MLRVQVGYEEFQDHTFPCPYCEQPLSVTFDLSRPPSIGLSTNQSCDVVQRIDDCAMVNLAVGFLIPKDKISDESYFPAMEFFLQPKLRQFMQAPSQHVGVGGLFEGFPGVARAWVHLCRAARFNLKGDTERETHHLAKFSESTGFPVTSFAGALLNFVGAFVGKQRRARMHTLIAWCLSVVDGNRNLTEDWFTEFANMSKDRVSEYLSILSEYFESYNDFDQTLFYARFGLDCETDAHASVNGFQNTKMFYGNAFEVLGSHLDFFVGLKNIKAGRPYSMLKNITLVKYRGSDKAARIKALEDVQDLMVLVEEYDSSLRNASHHRWFRLANDMQSIKYKKGGSGAEQTLSYASYTLRCNKLIMQLMIMYLCEVLLMGYLRSRGSSNRDTEPNF